MAIREFNLDLKLASFKASGLLAASVIRSFI
nr:MAG TPA: hypothetical protein [Podoviridae sp. ctY3D12]